MIKLSEQAQTIYDKCGRNFRYLPDSGTMQLCIPVKTAKALLAQHTPELTEIKALLKEQYEEAQEAANQRANNRAAIPGVKELTDARKALANYRDAYNRAWERGDGRLPMRPSIDLNALGAQFPRAAALLKAEEWAAADNDVKASAGRAAADAIINGEDYAEAITAMEKQWSDHCNEHMWN